MKIFQAGSHQFRESLRELLRELWFSYCSSREMPFREWNFVFREWNFEFRELLREYPGTLREFREWPFHWGGPQASENLRWETLAEAMARTWTSYLSKYVHLFFIPQPLRVAPGNFNVPSPVLPCPSKLLHLTKAAGRVQDRALTRPIPLN